MLLPSPPARDPGGARWGRFCPAAGKGSVFYFFVLALFSFRPGSPILFLMLRRGLKSLPRIP